MPKVQRVRNRPLMVMLSDEEREQFDTLAKNKAMSLRDLVVTSVLGLEPPRKSELHVKVHEMEKRLHSIEVRVCALTRGGK